MAESTRQGVLFPELLDRPVKAAVVPPTTFCSPVGENSPTSQAALPRVPRSSEHNLASQEQWPMTVG